MTFLATLFLGDGRFKPDLRAGLASEGVVFMEEGLRGSVRYRHFSAPGRRFHRKVTLERIALALTDERLAVYCRSGRVKLIDSAFSEPRLDALHVSLHGGDTVSMRVDYDRAGVPQVSGEVEIRAATPNALNVVEHLKARLER